MKDNRYSRQILIPEWNQDALKKTCVLVLGVGATGSVVATNLVLSGVGKIILVDYDTIEVSNLNRQLLFREEDVGKNKAYVAKHRLESLNPDVDIIDFGEKMQNISDELKNSVDIIASCLDTFEGRRWANSLALNIRKPMVNGGMFAFMGDIQTILPYDSACFECQPLVSQEKLAQACSPLGEKRKEEKNNIEKIALPSISTLSSIIGGLMSQEIIKLILGVGSLVKNYLFYDGLSNSFTELELKRTKECPLCGEGNKLKNSNFMVYEGELVKEILIRLKLIFGLIKPDIIFEGTLLKDNYVIKEKIVKNLFVIDEVLSSPLKLNLEYFEN